MRCTRKNVQYEEEEENNTESLQFDDFDEFNISLKI